MCRGSQRGSQKEQKGPFRFGQGACELGALGGTRTPNLLIRSQMLYPLSYERRRLHSLRHQAPSALPWTSSPHAASLEPYGW